MEVEPDGETEPVNQQAVYISDLPEELIEYIFFHLSPYRDLQSAKLVCRQWYRLVQGKKTKTKKRRISMEIKIPSFRLIYILQIICFSLICVYLFSVDVFFFFFLSFRYLRLL